MTSLDSHSLMFTYAPHDDTRYPGQDLLFSEVEFSINQNSRICLVGPNGIGKTTLLNVIYQELEPTQGLVTRNPRLRVGRFSQHQVDSLTMKKSVLEHMQGE
jgi:ATPase subunit of ABC transporter with duplicated ATPase domains